MTLIATFLHEGLERTVRSGLRGVLVRGVLPAGPVVWAANHHSWWDPFVANSLVRRHGRRVAVVMAEAGLDQFGFVRKLGVVGSTEVRSALTRTRAGDVLVVFPEAELRAPGPPHDLERGAAWFAEQAGATLLAAGVRVTCRGHEAPEAYVDLRPVPLDDGSAAATARLAAALRESLADLDRLVATSDPRQPLPGFGEVIRGRRSWDERIAGLGRRATARADR